MKVWMTRSLSLGDVLGGWGRLRWEKKEIKPAPVAQACPPPHLQGCPRLLGLLGGSSVVMKNKRAHGHGQVGPAHAGLAAEEQRRRGSAGVPQQQAGALLGGRDKGDGDHRGIQASWVCHHNGQGGEDSTAQARRGG